MYVIATHSTCCGVEESSNHSSSASATIRIASVITRRGGAVAAVVPIEVLRRFEDDVGADPFHGPRDDREERRSPALC